jgi:serine/threonine protein kinase
MAGHTQSTQRDAIESAPGSDQETGLDAAVAIAVEDFLGKLRRGEQPAVEDYEIRYPAAAEELRRVLPTLELLEAAKTRSPNPDLRTDATSHEQLGDFRIVREIGRGGMGIVYEAVQESLGRRVALKVLAPHSLLDAKTVRRFQREARSAAQLHHTNIVPVFGVGEEHGRHYYVMQFIVGQGLDGVIRALRCELAPGSEFERDAEPDASEQVADSEVVQSGLSTANLLEGQTAASSSFGSANTPRHWRNVARVACEIANALSHAHAQGTLHRDIKPSNILLDAGGTTWISDFGLAKAVDDEDLTTTGEVLGTLRYAPPEALQGKYDARSDVFGLGVTLYELSALRPARDATRREHLLRQVAHESAPRLDRLQPAIPRDLHTIVHKAIDVDPARRYQNVSELADDLRRFANDEPIRARRTRRIERAWRWCRRNPAISLITAAAVLIIGLTTAVAFWNVRTARDDAVQAFVNEQAERRNANASERAAQASLKLANEATAKAAASLAAEKIQLKLAEERTAEAKENLVFARAAVARYLTVIGDSPKLKAKGLEPLRRVLLENAREFYDQLADQRGDDTDLHCDRGNGYLRLGQLMQDVGQAREALELMDTAEAILRPLHERSPNYRRVLERLIACYEAQSGVLQRSADLVAAENKSKAALELTHRLAELHPDEFAVRFRLAKAYELYGVCISRGNDTDRIIEAFETSLKQYRELLADHQDHFELRRETSETLSNLGLAYHRARRMSEAESALDEALAILNKLAEESPEHVRTLGGLALVQGSLTSLYRDTDRKEKAIEICRESIRRFSELAERRTEIIFYQEYLARNLSRLAELLSAKETQQEADAAFARAIEIRKAILQKTSLASHRVELVSALMDRAKTLTAAEQPSIALPLIDECIQLVAEMDAAEQKALLSPLANAGFSLHRSKALLAMGRGEDAGTAIRDALERAEKVQADRPNDSRASAFVEECRMMLASVEAATATAADSTVGEE